MQAVVLCATGNWRVTCASAGVVNEDGITSKNVHQGAAGSCRHDARVGTTRSG